MEGFPNIFIEAWAFGVPVLSMFFDPGGIIEKNNLGVVAHGNLDKMRDAVVNLNVEENFGEKAKEYVEKYHAINNEKLQEITKLFISIYHKD